MAAWGNALGGYRRQKRDRKGRFTSSGRAAKKTYKAAKKRNAASHRSRVRGSAKARVGELRRGGPRRAKNIMAGAAVGAVGYTTGSERLYSAGVNQLKYGAKASYGRTNATRKMSKGLKRYHNKRAKSQYQAAIGSTKKTRALRNAAVVGIVAGAGYVGYKQGMKRGNLGSESRASGATFRYAQGRGYAAGVLSRSNRIAFSGYKNNSRVPFVEASAQRVGRSNIFEYNTSRSQTALIVNGRKVRYSRTKR